MVIEGYCGNEDNWNQILRKRSVERCKSFFRFLWSNFDVNLDIRNSGMLTQCSNEKWEKFNNFSEQIFIHFDVTICNCTVNEMRPKKKMKMKKQKNRFVWTCATAVGSQHRNICPADMLWVLFALWASDRVYWAEKKKAILQIIEFKCYQRRACYTILLLQWSETDRRINKRTEKKNCPGSPVITK